MLACVYVYVYGYVYVNVLKFSILCPNTILVCAWANGLFYVSLNWVIIGSGSSLSPVQHQAIVWINDHVMSDVALTYISEIWVKIKKNISRIFGSKNAFLENDSHFT